MPRPKKKISIQPDAPAPPARRSPPRLTDDPKPTAAAVKVDWKADPDCRAFACLLSFEAGWIVDPAEISWSYAQEDDVVIVQRPAAIPGLAGSTIAKKTMGAAAVILEIERRWGAAVRDKVDRFVYPQKVDDAAPQRPGPGARFLHQLANRVAATGATRERIEEALVEVVLRCADLARTANIGDATGSASYTRQMAAAAILDLVNPQAASR